LVKYFAQRAIIVHLLKLICNTKNSTFVLTYMFYGVATNCWHVIPRRLYFTAHGAGKPCV